MLQNLSSAAVVIGALSVEQILLVQPPGTAGWIKSYQKRGDLWWCAIKCMGSIMFFLYVKQLPVSSAT